MTDAKKLEKLGKIFSEAQWADFEDQERETMGQSRDGNRAWNAGMSAVLKIIEQEHEKAIGQAYHDGFLACDRDRGHGALDD